MGLSNMITKDKISNNKG